MKKFLSIAFGLICCAAAVLACFDDDPFSNLSNHGTTITGGGGSNTGINLPGDLFPVEKFPDEDRNNSYAMVIETAFPCTLSVNFSGFIDADGNEVTEPIIRMCVLYFSTAGKWVILKDIRNPQYRIVSTADEKLALFGRHTIPSPMGYAKGRIIPIMLYFSSANYSNFDLSAVLKSPLKTPLPNTAIGLVSTDNIKPF